MAEDEEWANFPLAEQFAHKNWKARKGGYEAAANQFKTAQPTDPIVKDFLYDSQLWKGAVGDSNVAAQQEALNAYNAFLDAAGTEGARRTRGVTVGPVVEKGLTGRPAAKASAQEALLLLIELDKADPVIEELLGYFSHKQPKIIAATLEALAGIVRAYGMKIVEPKPILKLLPKIYGHADKNVRAQGQNLTVEMYRWLREAMKPLFWNELKDVQQKDLDKLFEPVKPEPAPKQERLLRSQQAAKEQEEAAGGGEEDGEEDAEDRAEIDLEPEYEPVDVLAKVPKDFNDRLASTKWKDRKEALDETLAAVDEKAIIPGPFDDIIRGCAKSMKDANIAVVTVAANVVEKLATGLKKDFSKYRSSILAPMLERLKEKKASVITAIGAACDAVCAATSLGEVQADVFEALKSKNPQVKENTAKFLARALTKIKEAPTIEQNKEICEVAKNLMAESTEPLRDAGTEVLAVLWKIMGDRNMKAYVDGLDENRRKKFDKMIQDPDPEKQVVAKWRPKSAAPPAKAAAPAGKKPALGTKRPAAKKAAPPKPVSPPLDDDAPALQPRASTRPGVRPAGLKPPGGLKTPGSGLARPGTGLKAPSAGAASPRRQAPVADDPPPPSTPKPSAGAGRGLAGRPLGKPALAPTSPPAVPRADPAASALSSIERQELQDLRAEVDLARQQASDLRTDKMRLTSQVAELQVQNAQLIEDHTRDVLQIKAKETQLVRARSAAESAEDRANSLSKEIDRLKREISRLGRNRAGRDSPIESAPTSPRPAYGSSRSFNVPSTRGYGINDGYGDDARDRAPSGTSRHSRPESNGNASGRATPSEDRDGGSRAGLGGSQGEGVESWRRAAEVTQNLKARIEMMKARQNIGRGQ